MELPLQCLLGPVAGLLSHRHKLPACHRCKMNYADLEIRILSREVEGYPVEITFSGEQEFPRGFLDPAVTGEFATVAEVEQGNLLFKRLFEDTALKTAWATAAGQNPNRRIRLRIDAGAPELHALPWEMLTENDIGTGTQRLAAAQATPFSRYLAGQWRAGRPVLERPLKLLVAVANPDDLGRYNLDPIDPDLETTIIREAAERIPADQLMVTILPTPVTLSAIETTLRQGGHHILHLVSHGRLTRRGHPILYLADDQNATEPVTAVQFGEMLDRLEPNLRLVVLGSCQSATQSPGDAFRGFAPGLIVHGVPAVLAMQDRVPVATARAFHRVFYEQLFQHGQVDLAANLARASLLTAGVSGAAVPALFMRLRNGVLFTSRGQILGERAESFWQILLDNIADGRCTPFLGPKVNLDLLPTTHEVAQSLAHKHNYPFRDTHNLPMVTQFIRTIDDYRMRRDVIQTMIAGFRRRMGLAADRRDRRRSLSEVISLSEWSEQVHRLTESPLHHQLAALELPLYLTTNYDNFMTLALAARGLPGRRETIGWRNDGGRHTGQTYFDLAPPPSPEKPVVLHLYGNDDDMQSMVLTEDDHLDYLAAISQDHEYLLPTSVNEALASTTLLFLGYDLNDLDFKVIMRGLLRNVDLQRWNMLHVAVQLEAETVDEDKQREVITYFQKYFGDLRIDVYWGSTRQFVTDLYTRWQASWHE